MNKKLLNQLYSNSKTIILYGASSSGLRALNNLIFMNIDKDRILFFDSNPSKQGQLFVNIPILTNDEFKKINKESLILITSCMHYEISPILKKNGYSNYYFDQGLIYTNRVFEKFTAEFLSDLQKISSFTNMDFDELYTLYHCLDKTKDLDGAIAEVGVYKGGSAYILGKYSHGKNIFLFDTFTGLPDLDHTTINEPAEGWLADTNTDIVLKNIYCNKIEMNKFKLIKGIFPASINQSAIEIDKSFSLVHLDTDLYLSTYNGLEYFYPKLEEGGRIIVHDYNCVGCPGVKEAVDNYCQQHNLAINLTEVAESQVILIKPKK